MTFEPIDWNDDEDEDEDDDTIRPMLWRFKDRAERRRQAIADVLTEHGPLTIAATARALHRRWSLMVVLDLDSMERQGRVVSRWLYVHGKPKCLEYRLPTLTEQSDRAATDAAFEQHLRDVLHDAANHITIPGEPS